MPLCSTTVGLYLLDIVVVSAKCFKISMHQMRVKFFQSFNSIYARSSRFTEPVIQHLVSAMCTIYNVSLRLLPTVYYYTGQSDIYHDIVNRRHQFLSRCKFSSNQIIRYITDRFH